MTTDVIAPEQLGMRTLAASDPSEGQIRLFAVLVLIALWIPWQAVGFNLEINAMDEGTLVHQATRILQGDVIYRDFFEYYPPGYYYLMAGLFWLFGPSLMLSRLLTVVSALFVVTTIFLAARTVSPPSFAALAWLYGASFPLMDRFHGLPSVPSVGLALLASVLLDRRMRSGGRMPAFAAGGLVGTMILIRHDVGLGVILVHVCVLLGFHWSQAPKDRRGKTVSGVLAYLSGAALAVGPVALYFICQVPVADLLQQLVLTPLSVYPHSRHLPFPPLIPSLQDGDGLVSRCLSTAANFQFYAPFAVACSAGALLVVMVRVGRMSARDRIFWTLCDLLLLQGVFFVHLMGRADYWHLFPCLATSAVLCSWAGGVLAETGKRWLLGGVCTICILASVYPGVVKAEMLMVELGSTPMHELAVARAKRIRVPLPSCQGAGPLPPSETQLYETAVQHVMRTVRPDEAIFVAQARHDRLTTTDNLFYFLSERRSATFFDKLHPGITTRADVQRVIIDDLERNHVACVVRWKHSGTDRNEVSVESGARLLDDFLREQFRVEADYGAVEILRRRHL